MAPNDQATKFKVPIAKTLVKPGALF